MKSTSVELLRIPEVGSPSPCSYYSEVRKSVDKTLVSISSQPTVREFFVEDTSDFLENFLTLSPSTKLYLDHFHHNFFGALDSDFDLFKDLLTNYIRSLLLESEFLPLVDLLYKCFIKMCHWKNDKSLYKFCRQDPGIYVLYNNVTFVSYIGETNNLERRFVEHKVALQDGTHFNKNLKKKY